MLRKQKPKRHVSCRKREERPVAAGVDDFNRESLAIRVGASIKGDSVVEVLQRLNEQRRLPQTIRVDHGPEFGSKLLEQWACLNGVELDFSRPGKPTDNAFIESFNGRLRQGCLNEKWFLSLQDAEEKGGSWRKRYNEEGPHSALGNLSSREFAVQAEIAD